MAPTTLKSAPNSERSSPDRTRSDRTAVAREPVVAEASVGMGQIALLSPEGIGRAVLGSCIGLVLFEPMRRFAAMAHIVLPSAEGREGGAGKFVDTAVPLMVDQLRRHGIEPSSLIAKCCGGASMFATSGPFQIGQQNVEAIRRQLATFRIRLAGEHVGGTRGRRTSFDCRTGEMLVEVLGAASVKL